MNMRMFVRLVMIAFAAFISPAVSAQTSFYLTFERSFSTREDVQLRLDYADRKDPFTVRILRPTDVKRFLEGQFAVSRSYEEPRAALNPAFFVTKGINAVESPVRAFQRLLSPEFRNSFGEGIGPSLRNPVSRAMVGQARKLVYEPPAGFEMVREFAVDLRLGGIAAEDSWWWFFDEASDGWGFKVRMVNLGRLPSGLYMIQVLQGDQEAQALLQVSELSVQVKQSSSELVVRAIDRDGRAVPGATIEYRDDRGDWAAISGVTAEDGCLQYRHSRELSGKLLVSVRDPAGNTAYADTDFLSTKSTAQSMFIMTDRPIFRPGDGVSFKGIVRRKDQGQPKADVAALTAGVPVNISLSKPGASVRVQAQQIQRSSFGTLSGRFELGESQEPGLYSVVAEVDKRPYAGELRVRDYVKPTYYLEMLERSGQLRPGHTFTYRIRARRYAGGVPAGARYEVFVYRKKYEVPQFVEEAGGALSTGSDYFGGMQSASALTQPQRVYSSLEARTPRDRRWDVPTWSSAAQFDAQGEATGEIPLPPLPQGSGSDGEWTYTILFRAMDREGAFSVLSENFHQTVAEAVLSARFSSSVSEPGQQETTFTVRATTPDGDPLPQVQGEVRFTLSTASGQFSTKVAAFNTDAGGYAVVPVSPYSNIGIVEGIAIARGRSGRSWSNEARAERQELLVVEGKGESVRSSADVSLFANSSVLSPGEKVKVYALLPDVWGSGNKGPIWRITAGESIFGSAAINVEGRSVVFESEAKAEFGTGYFETISVPLPDGKFREATMAFRIVPRQQRLSIDVQPERDVGEPMKPFTLRAAVKRFDGSPARGVEVSLAVVDRAVYAVQPEFRPGIFDFFFPLPRLNLMTFYSDELQGYGYADKIRRPNFSLSAIKSQAKLSKRSVRDTAGWFPHLVTDGNGEVSATVDMPANLTEWTVTAVAVGTDGECGEGHGRFRTAVDVEVEPRVPQFLRRGDKVVVPVGVRNQTDQEVELAVTGHLQKQGITELMIEEKGIVVPARDVVSRTVNVSTENAVDSLLMDFTSTAPPGIKAGGVREFEVPVRAAAMGSSLSAASRDTASVRFQMARGSVAQALSLVATRGALGVALSKTRELLTYPYGCAEQLAHSTYPNVLLLELSRAVPNLERRMSDLSQLVSRARENVASGVQKLLAYQKPDGGFSLWPTDPVTSPSITLMVHEVLSQASQLEVEQVNAPLTKSSAWFDAHVAKVNWAPWQLAKLAQYVSDVDLTNAQASFVVSVNKKINPTLADLVYGLSLLQHYETMSWHRFFNEVPDAANVKVALERSLVSLLGTLALDGVAFRAEDFSSESLGFSPSRSVLIGDTILALRKMQSPPAALVKKLERRLLDDLGEGRIWSPLDAALVINALKPAILADLQEHAGSKAEAVEIHDAQGKVIGTAQPIAAGYAANLDAGSLEGKDLSQVTLRATAADLTVVGDLTLTTPYAEIVAQGHGVSIARTLLRVTPHGTEVVSPETTLSVGDVVVSKLEVSRPSSEGWWSSRSPSEWFVVQEGIPAIAEGVDDDQTMLADAKVVAANSTLWSDVKETLRYPDRTERVVRLGMGGSLTTYSVWRISYEGEAVAPPARVFNMYLKGLEGHTSSVGVRSSKR